MLGVMPFCLGDGVQLGAMLVGLDKSVQLYKDQSKHKGSSIVFESN